MNVFEEVKARVRIGDIVEFYGVKFKHKKALCPFHNDKNPNFTISDTLNIFKCHACDVKGDAIYFVSKLFSIKPIDAIKRLNEDFKLNLSIGKPSIRDLISFDRQKKEREEFKKWKSHALNVLCENYKKYERMIEENAPLTELWVEGVNGIDYASYLYDEFCECTDIDKRQFEGVVYRLARGKEDTQRASAI